MALPAVQTLTALSNTPDLGLRCLRAFQETAERGSIEGHHLKRGLRPHCRDARGVVQEADLSEVVAGIEPGDRDLSTVGSGLRGLGLSLDYHIEAIGGHALPQEYLPPRKNQEIRLAGRLRGARPPP